MSVEITGKLQSVLPEVTGTGRNGTWIKQSFVIETEGQYPRQVCFDAWGDKADTVKSLGNGDMLKISFEPDSKEFNGKWYTNLRAWRIDRMDGAAAPTAPAASTTDAVSAPPPPPPAAAEDDLPF